MWTLKKALVFVCLSKKDNNNNNNNNNNNLVHLALLHIHLDYINNREAGIAFVCNGRQFSQNSR